MAGRLRSAIARGDGAMILGTVLAELSAATNRPALVTLCIGGGMGTATIIERVKDVRVGQRRVLRRAHHLKNPTALVGTLRFAHPTTERYNRRACGQPASREQTQWPSRISK